MSQENHTVGIAVTCVDARLHKETITPQLRDHLGVDSVYVWTTAGPEARIMADNHHLAALMDDLELLIAAKDAKVIGVVGHCDCAGHPVSDEQHVKDVVRSVAILQERLPNLNIVPLLAHPPQEEMVSVWEIRKIS